MSRGNARKRRNPSINYCNNSDTFLASSPDAKRLKISNFEPDSGQISDDNNTISTTSQSVAVLTPSPQLHHSNINHQNHDLHHTPSTIAIDHNMIDLGIEFPQLSHVLHVKKNDELALDTKFDLAQFTVTQNNDANHKPFPMIFNWEELTQATNPQQLRTEALRKQERGKYVRRDSLSSEQAADRRRRQNRESARRTRDRVRKYITVLEMYYAHVHKINCLLVKQFEVMAKHCTQQLTDDERANLKMYTWPKPPTIEECMNAKPATISATSSVKKSISPLQTFTNESVNNPQTKCKRRTDANANKIAVDMNMKFDNIPSMNLPTLNLPQNVLNNANHHHHHKQNGAKTSQINIMQMNHHNNMNILNHVNNNNVQHTLNPLNALKPFEQELLQCGVSLNAHAVTAMNNNNAQYLIQPMMNASNILRLQTVPNNNVLTLRNVNVLPTAQFNNINSLNMHMVNGS